MLEQFLQDKEDRVIFQKNLIKKYGKTLLTVRTNYPGDNKNEFVADEISSIMANTISKIFAGFINYETSTSNLEGLIYFFIIDMDAKIVKKKMMELEEKHILGRCVDLDVYDFKYNALSRKDFDMPKRKCMLCEDLAFVCARTKKHNLEELKYFIASQYNKYKNYEIKRNEVSHTLSNLALKGMIYEVSSSTSFGLVSPLTTGSHSDMNFFTFLASSFAISKGFYEMARVSYSYLTYDEILIKIREIGKKTEEEMMKATNNVNTHKGMIFLLGISVAATAKNIYEGKDFENIQDIIKYMTKDILNDFKDIHKKKKEDLTHGEKLYLDHGFLGIRGEINNGLDIVFKGSLEVFDKSFENSKDFDFASRHTLIYLMGNIMDSTIVYRKDIKTLQEVRKTMKELFDNSENGNYNKERLEEIEKDYISRRISPGGSADLLGITIFFYNVLQNYIRRVFL